MGCPEHRFPPVGNAGYAPNPNLSVGVSNPGCCDPLPRVTDTRLNPIKVAAMFVQAMVAWKRHGFAVLDSAGHTRRFVVCQKCPHYRYFLCQLCACVAYLKTKLAGQACPDNPPRWT
jgi:hypothetical protein